MSTALRCCRPMPRSRSCGRRGRIETLQRARFPSPLVGEGGECGAIAKHEPGEGFSSQKLRCNFARAHVHANPSPAFASLRHPLPQGERGKSASKGGLADLASPAEARFAKAEGVTRCFTGKENGGLRFDNPPALGGSQAR